MFQKFLMVLTLLTLASCTAIAVINPAHAQDFSTMRSQTVMVAGDQGMGSGVVIDKNHILTAKHVVDGERGLTVRFFGHQINVNATVVKTDDKNDTAILRVSVPTNILTPVFNCTKLMYGEKIYVIGFPLGLPWILTQGNIASDLVGDLKGSGVIVDVAMNHGNSGGPVFNSKGEVVGISDATVGDAKHEGSTFSVIMTDICEFTKGLK